MYRKNMHGSIISKVSLYVFEIFILKKKYLYA